MIESLHIENIAVVKTVDIDMKIGFTALSGETGAGKSIIIDSLGLLLGARADKELIRNGENSATVSALFSGIDSATLDLIEELGFPMSDDSALISRTVTTSGSSARFNGRAIPISMLREISSRLFNIHGQNDNLQMLDPKNHISILDSYASCRELLEEYGELYKKTLHIKCEMDLISADSVEKARLAEMLRFQISDIDSAKLKAGEEEELEELSAKLKSSEKISKSCALVNKAVKGGDKGLGASYLVSRASSALDAISDVIPEATELSAKLENIKYELDDIADSVSALCDFGEYDITAKLDKCEARLDVIAKLKRKYGSSVEEIISFRNNAEERLSDIENADEKLSELKEELLGVTADAKKIAGQIHEKRVNAAKGLTEGVTENLTFLDMPKVRFEVKVTETDELGARGTDIVEFLIATNPGEPMHNISKIASGGELARIMLSIKNILNQSDGISTVIFDEIDTGISGKTSRKVGIKLKEIGKRSQVICVTHSAQIASLADNHLYISKDITDDGRVESRVEELDGDRRVLEIARILGGIEITDAQMRAAHELIAESEIYG